TAVRGHRGPHVVKFGVAFPHGEVRLAPPRTGARLAWAVRGLLVRTCWRAWVFRIRAVPPNGYTESGGIATSGLAQHLSFEVVTPPDVEVTKLHTSTETGSGKPCPLHALEWIGQRAQINIAAGGRVIDNVKKADRLASAPVEVDVTLRASRGGWLRRATITSA